MRNSDNSSGNVTTSDDEKDKNEEHRLSLFLPPNVRDCTTINIDVRNCGIEEYAYLSFIERNWDNLPEHVAFVQGNPLTENPHVMEDIWMSARIRDLSFRDLSRHVRNGWHTEHNTVVGRLSQHNKNNNNHNNTSVESIIINETIPTLQNFRVWKTGWRGMYMVSRQAIKRHPLTIYQDLNRHLCQQTCAYRNCMFESINSPFWGCSDVHFLEQGGRTPPMYDDEVLQDGCVRETIHDVALAVDYVDFRKDSIYSDDVRQVAHEVQQITCLDRTILFSNSGVNGLLMCIERGYHAIDDSDGDGDSDGYKGEINGNAHLRKTHNGQQTDVLSSHNGKAPSMPSSSAEDTESTSVSYSKSSSSRLSSLFTVADLQEILAYRPLPNMDDLDWRYKHVSTDVKQPSWSNRRSDFYNASRGE
jgi:hypothetical protein